MERIKFACSLDCFDLCSLVAVKDGGRIVKIEGDKDHPVTKGFICKKGRDHLERLYHKNRFFKPRIKKDGQWHEISYEEAIGLLSEKLSGYIKEYGPESILHYNDSGYGGMSKDVDNIFFNGLGGVTSHTGTLCWGAGDKAQKYDFGANRSHNPEDFENSKMMILWGRNPADTNIHLMSFIKNAKKRGCKVILIDPFRTNSASIADDVYQVRPGTDAALALGMANYIIENGLSDGKYIKDNTLGFEQFKAYAKEFTIEKTSEITGLSSEAIVGLAKAYGSIKPASIIVGYGLQRYRNGGNTVRAIDALGAITGNIGVSGGGIHYNNKKYGAFVGDLTEQSAAGVENRRTYSKANFAEFIFSEKETPVKCMFVTKANPMVQLPNTNKAMEAFKQIEFKVGIDLFVTDTLEHCDLIFPATTILEEEDVIYSSMFNPYMLYSHRVVEPLNGIVSEYDLFMQLADKMDVKAYPRLDRDAYFNGQLRRLFETFNTDLDQLKKSPIIINKDEIAWEDGKFLTPSGKFELYSEKAKGDGLSPLPVYMPIDKKKKAYPIRLMTTHHRNSLHSQGFMDVEGLPEIYLSETDLLNNGVADGDEITVRSEYGELRAVAKVKKDMLADTALMYEGYWHKSGCVNLLTPDGISDMGEQAIYYECFICIR